MTIAEFVEKVGSHRQDSEAELLRNAAEYAAKAHEGQLRDSGEEYIQHPLEVATIVDGLGMDTTSVIAALLHDVVEDTQITLEEITQKFGPEVALLVDGVTKLTRLNFQTQQERQMENLRKMFLAMTHDLRVIVIKLADRLHNMRTLKHVSEARQKKIAKETLDVYAPLAHRLGMWMIKWELEDLALRYLDPEAYYDLVNKVSMKRQEREGFIEDVKNTLLQSLEEAHINAVIKGRPKHFYSIYHKMVEQSKDFSEIYDLLGMRVIVETVQDCYETLGIVHTLWKPMPGRFKDYVAMPKSNMYQSLHTTVIGPHGEPFEVQIRTKEMDKIAEYGIAAHWVYKENVASNQGMRDKIAWLRHLIEWQGEMKDTEEFMETLKIGLFVDEVFVFTPKGDVKSLPAGSTPIDFAYGVHTNLGHQCTGAKINGKLVPLDYQLQNGDIIQIITSKQSSGPSRDWLRFVKTSKAKNRIRQWLREQFRDENIQLGREMLERELKKQGLDIHESLRQEALLDGAKKLGFTTIEDLLASIGDLKVTANTALGKILPERQETKELPILSAAESEEKRKNKNNHHGVTVRGEDDVLVKFSRCCNPVPGDEIVGFITRGKGVAVHRSDCVNINQSDKERLIEVEWSGDSDGLYPVDIEIVANDRVNLLTDIMNAISEMKLYMSSVQARSKKGTAYINLTIDISHGDQIQAIFKRIKQVEGIAQVYRVSRLVR